MEREDTGVVWPRYAEYPAYIRDQDHGSEDLLRTEADPESSLGSEEEPEDSLEFRRRFKANPAGVGIQPSQFLTWIKEDPEDLTTWIWCRETKIKEQHKRFGEQMKEVLEKYNRKTAKLEEARRVIEVLKQDNLQLTKKADKLQAKSVAYAELEKDLVTTEVEARRLRAENRGLLRETEALKLKEDELTDALKKAATEANPEGVQPEVRPVLVSRGAPNIMERNAELEEEVQKAQEEIQQLQELLDRKEEDIRKMKLQGYRDEESDDEETTPSNRLTLTKRSVKPLKWNYPKFDGKPENLTRYLHRAETDFELYPESFGSGKRKVHYAIQGLDTRPDNWVQQYYENDTEGVLESWELYKSKVKAQFEDPNLLINRRTQMLNLRATSYPNFQDFLAEFESLNATVKCDEGTTISFFLQALPWRVETQIRRDGINGLSFQQVKLKAVTLQQEEERLQQVRNRNPARNQNRTITRKDTDRKPTGPFTKGDRNSEDRYCYHCGKKGHISTGCPLKKTATVDVKAIEQKESSDSEQESKN